MLYMCILSTSNKEQEEKCKKLDYILFTTEEQKKMCDLMGCGKRK